MSAPAGLCPRVVFGFRSTVRDAVHYCEDGSVVYPAGHSVVVLASDGKSQRFIAGTPEAEGITALALSPNKKLLAVAERAEKGIISVYDVQTLKRRKVLLAADVGSKEYVSLSFSPDGRLLLAQGAAPDWNLLLWAWEKSKVATSVRATNSQGAPLYQCSISPGEGSMVSVVGQGILRVFKVADASLKPLQLSSNRRENVNFTCQAWLNGREGGNGDGGGHGSNGGERERQVLGAGDGEITLLEGTEFKATFSCENALPVTCLLATSKGLVAGQAGGLVTLFERDDRDQYRKTRAFSVIDHPYDIRSMAVSPNDESLVVALAKGAAFTLALNNQELMRADEMNFETLGASVHLQGITGLDCCIRRPLLATCSIDRTVRLWNWSERACELSKTFTEEATSVAIHPTGLMLLVGFSDKLRLMTVLMDELRTVKEVAIKGCRDSAFSNGGQFFAATNGTTVSIYSTYTAENLGNLRGHNGKVRSIYWSADDSSIISGGMDGAVYEWRLSDLKRAKENVLKGCAYTSVLITPDGKSLVAAGSDNKIKELEETAGSGTQITKEIETGQQVTALALPFGGKVLFAGTESGSVRCYKYPLTGEFYESKCHEGPVSRLRISYDDCLLFSTGEDGSLVVHDIRDKELLKASTRRDQEKLPWSEEVLVTKSELEERRSRMGELEQQVAELTMQTEYQLRLKDLHVQERIKELSDKFNAELEADRQKFDLLLGEKNEQEMEYEDKLKQAEARSNAQLAALDAQFQAKVMSEVERYQTLLHEKELLNDRWDEQNALLVESHERVISELTEDYEAKLAEEALKLETLRQEKAHLEREFEEVKRQLEEDADREIEDMKDKYEQRLNSEREATLRLKGENGIMRKNILGKQKEVEEQREELDAQKEQQRDLYTTIKGLEKDIASLKREIRERDETIGDKERRIYELKKKNQELEKFKYVLDYKIKELKKQIEPREEEIAEMRETIRAMDGELERYHKSNAGLDLTIQNLKLKQAGLQQEVGGQRGAKADALTQLRKVQADIAALAAAMQDPKVLKEKAKALYQRHCCDEAVVPQVVEEDVAAEYARQREYLERTLEGLKRKLARDSELHRLDALRVMGDNCALLKEINELRREIKVMKSSSPTRGGPAAAAAAAAVGSTSAAKRSTTGSNNTAATQQQQQQPSSSSSAPDPAVAIDGMRRELDMQRELIARLRSELDTRDARIRTLETTVVPRPMSRERLPPMDGFKGAPHSAGSRGVSAGHAAGGIGVGGDPGVRPMTAGSLGSAASHPVSR